MTKRAPTNFYLQDSTHGADVDDFWFIQRLGKNTSPKPSAVGLDRSFSMEYMGSSEFEGNIAFVALYRLRQHTDNVVKPVLIERNNFVRTIYFVGPRSQLAVTTKTFAEWFGASSLASAEPTSLVQNFEGTDDEYRTRTVAWWPLAAEAMFTLDSTVAEQLLQAIVGE